MNTLEAQLARLDERSNAMAGDLTEIKTSLTGLLADHETRLRALETGRWKMIIGFLLASGIGGLGGAVSAGAWPALLKVIGG